MSLPWKTIFAYGLLAAVLLGCLYLFSLAPLSLDWGRELLGAAIAIVALAVGLHLSRDHEATAPAATRETADASIASTDALDIDASDANMAATEAPTLSTRERQILELLAEGLSNKQLARALSVSENTVKTHLGNLYAKLGVGRRTEALAVARRRRLLR
jgi:ATP/maltotriose-dependent transcriptional regulator MalT